MQKDTTRKITVCILRSNPIDPDSRVEKEAYALQHAGYDVTIACWDRVRNHKPNQSFLNILNEQIKIVRFGYQATYGEGFKNILPFLRFQMSLRKYIRRNRFDIVHACDFDTSFFTYRIVKRKREKLVFDIFDFVYCEPREPLNKTHMLSKVLSPSIF